MKTVNQCVTSLKLEDYKYGAKTPAQSASRESQNPSLRARNGLFVDARAAYGSAAI